MENQKLSFLDLLIETLSEHEKALSELVDRLEKVVEESKPVVVQQVIMIEP